MSGPSWDPARYLQFADERARPYWDLLARVPVVDAHLVVDLGCGPGTQTARLCDRWPDAQVIGVDSSPAMIQRASALAGPRVAFELADLRAWDGGAGADVVVSNATLHWVPGHLDLLARWMAWLAPGGALALQVPANFDAPSHTALRDLARQDRWRAQLGSVSGSLAVHTAGEYERRLLALGAQVDLWETVYHHRLTGDDAVLEWVRGSALRPYLEALGPDDAAEFESCYAERLRVAYPPDGSGGTPFDFRRLFVVARPGGADGLSG